MISNLSFASADMFLPTSEANILSAETDIVVATNAGQTSSGTIQVGIIYSCD